MKKKPTRYLSVGQVADRLGVVKSTIMVWVENLGLPAHRIGSTTVRIPEDGLNIWLKGLEITPSGPAGAEAHIEDTEEDDG